MNPRHIFRKRVLVQGTDGKFHRVDYAHGQIEFTTQSGTGKQTVVTATMPMQILSIDGKPIQDGIK